MSGRLVLAGTPIGDARDASAGLREALAGADVLAAEDTRRLRTLLARLGLTVAAPIVSYFEGNEEARTAGLVEAVRDGGTVVLVTDAGMPCVSDPGYRLVRACLAAGLPVTAVPGPSAVLTALAVSGLPTDRFCFEGFLPRTGAARRRRIGELAAEARTMVFFEAPHRVAATLADLADGLGTDRPAAVCRELTKPYEEVVRGDLGELATWAAGGVRGEVTLVVGGADPAGTVPSRLAEAVFEVGALVAAGAKTSAAVAQVAVTSHLPRRELYQAVLAARPHQDMTRSDR